MGQQEWVEKEGSCGTASPSSGAPEKMGPLPSPFHLSLLPGTIRPAPGRRLFFPLSILVALKSINDKNGHHLLSICYTLSTM